MATRRGVWGALLLLSLGTTVLCSPAVFLREGSNAEFPCNYPSSYQNPRVEWKFTSGTDTTLVYYEGELTAPYKTRATFFPQGLRLSSVTRKDSGEYSCEVTGGGNPQLFQDKTPLVVLVPPSVPIAQVPASVSTGGTVTLYCIETDASPPPTFTWYKNGVLMPPNPKDSPTFQNSSYTIDPTTGQLTVFQKSDPHELISHTWWIQRATFLKMEEMLKALLQANAVQRETNRQVAEAAAAQQAALLQANAVQRETNRQVAEAAAAQQEIHRQVAEAAAAQQAAQQEMNRQFAEALVELKKGSTPPVAAEPKILRASYHLQKMTPADDVEAFMATFERVAVREGWPKEQWAGLLAPFLTGEPQKAYFDLETDKAQDYETLKSEILARLGVTMAVRAQRVHQWSYSSNKPPRSQMFDLVHLTRKWLQPETLTSPQIVERVVMDRYLRALPAALRRWVGQGDPNTAAQMVDLVEKYSATEDLVNPPTPHLGVSRGARSPSGSADRSGDEDGRRTIFLPGGQL